MVELVKFANTFPQMRMVFDFATHIGGHAWRNIVTNVIADSERYNLTSVTKLTVVKLSFAMSSLSVYSAESGGEKRNYSLFYDDHSNNDSNDGVNTYDNEIDYGGANDFMGRIPKNMTAAHQVTLLFQEYDESKPKTAETTNVTVNLFNFISAIAGDSVIDYAI